MKQRLARLTMTRRVLVIVALVVGGVVVATGYLVGTALAAANVAAPTISSSPSNPTTSTTATFTFSDTKAAATFKCSLDGSAYTSCASGISYAGLAQGNHTFGVEAVSGASTSSATVYTWAIVPPAPTITSSPSNPTTSTTATFAFSDTQAGVGFSCSLDSSAFASCASGTTYTGLTGGSHTFEVEAVVGSNPASVPATSTWTITTPTPTIASQPANPTASTSATFTYLDTQAGATFECSRDGAKYTTCPSSGTTYTGLAQGTHTFAVEAQLGAGPLSTPATDTWQIDTSPPSIALTFPTTTDAYNQASWAAGCSPAGICGTASDSSGVAQVGVGILQKSTGKYWNGSSFSSSSLVFTTATGTTSWDYPFAEPADGVYKLYVEATDSLGNTTASADQTTASFTTDTVVPAAPVIVDGPTNPSTVTSPLFVFTDSSYPNVTYFCSMDSSPAVNCSGDPDRQPKSAGENEWQYESLAPGPHCFSIYAVDEADNVGPATNYCWTITTTPAAIAVSSGSGQSATVHTAFASPLAAKVTDAQGNPVSGVTVTFTAPGSGASATFASCSGGNPTTAQCVATTSATGIATSSALTATTLAGGPYTVTATVSGVSLPANFSLTNTAGAATTIAATSGSGQSTTVHTAFASPLVATVTDAYGNPLSGVTVTFAAPGSGASGTFAGSVNTAATNASGIATSPTFTANTTAGSYNVSASASGTGSVNFAESNTAGAATTVAASSGSGQSATVHTAFASPLVVTVTDTYGNPVSGVTVTFAAPGSGASATFASCPGGNPTTAQCVVITSATGIATSSALTATTLAGGPYTVTATVSGVSLPAKFSLTDAAGPATTIAVSSGSGQSATVHTAFASPLVAKVTDAYGNPLSGVTVTFAAPGSGASGTFAGSVNTAATNASGIATSPTFTANTTAGSYNVSASASGTGSVNFAESNTAGAAVHLVFATQPASGQKITAGSPTAFTVDVVDTYGNVESADNSTQVNLTVSANPGGSTLSCTDAGGSGPVAVSGGVAAFTCSLNKAGSGYTIGATSTPAHGTATTNAFTVVAASASKLVFTTQPPASTPASSTFSTSVSIEDLFGNVVTGDTTTVTLSLSTNPCAGTLTGTTSKAAVAGVATFSNLQITTACTGYALQAADAADGPVTATSTSFSIAPASVSKLVFTAQPPASTPGTSTFSVGVSIEDLYGNVVTGDTHVVTLSLSTNPCAGTLTGTTSKAAVAGVATFSNLQITTACTGYALQAADAADGPVTAISSPFAITGAVPAAVNVSSGSPQFTTVSTAFGSPLVAKVTDSQGNPVSGVAVTFTAPASGASGAFVSCSGGNPTAYSCVVTTNAGGLATASTFTANGTAGAYSVTAAVTGVVTPATFSLINSANFTISGNASLLYPGTSQKVNLTFTNPNPSPISVASGAVTITITTTQAGCPVSPNFTVTQGLTATVTVPANSTKSLSDLGIAQSNWPVVTMVDTHANQDACEGAALTLHYSGSATG